MYINVMSQNSEKHNI